MRRTLSVFLLSVLFGLAPGISAQAPPGDTRPAGEQESGFTLEQNYPNPFNPCIRPYLQRPPAVRGHPDGAQSSERTSSPRRSRIRDPGPVRGVLGWAGSVGAGGGVRDLLRATDRERRHRCDADVRGEVVGAQVALSSNSFRKSSGLSSLANRSGTSSSFANWAILPRTGKY